MCAAGYEVTRDKRQVRSEKRSESQSLVPSHLSLVASRLSRSGGVAEEFDVQPWRDAPASGGGQRLEPGGFYAQRLAVTGLRHEVHVIGGDVRELREVLLDIGDVLRRVNDELELVVKV